MFMAGAALMTLAQIGLQPGSFVAHNIRVVNLNKNDRL
jgi:hypothetical protein